MFTVVESCVKKASTEIVPGFGAEVAALVSLCLLGAAPLSLFVHGGSKLCKCVGGRTAVDGPPCTDA
jgi:hypothetical protein